MYPLSTKSLHSAHTTLHRLRVPVPVRRLLCHHSKGLRASRPYAVQLSPAPLPLSVCSTPESVSPPIVGARVIACAYRSRSLDSHSRVELFYRVTISRSHLAHSRSAPRRRPLGSKPRFAFSGLNPGAVGRRKFFTTTLWCSGEIFLGLKPCSRVAQSWQASYQASGEAKVSVSGMLKLAKGDTVKATFLGAGVTHRRVRRGISLCHRCGVGKGSGVKRRLASRIH